MPANHLHPDLAELEQFVRGELDSARLGSFESHVAGCEACATALVREARLELVMVELASAPPRNPRPMWIRRAGMAIAVAAAALIAVWLSYRNTGASGGVRPIARTVCAAGVSQAACIERAHRHGLVVDYPAWAGPPPLGLGDRDVARVPASPVGPSRPPFSLAGAVDPGGALR